MFFLGILGVLQILALPGLITTRILKLRLRWVAQLMAVICTSLVVNYCLVFFLTTIHIYYQWLGLSLVLVEVIALVFLYRNDLKKPIEILFERIINSAKELFQEMIAFFTDKTEQSKLFLIIKVFYISFCLLLAYIALNWIIKLFLWNLGSVFNSYDTIAIWNRWSISWANNMLPSGTWRYPQLIPTSWSMIYLLMGDTSIQFFNKAIMPLFSLFILLMTSDLGFLKKNPGFFIGTGITYLAIKRFLGPFVIEGLADIPCAFFAYAAVYFLIVYKNEHSFQAHWGHLPYLIAACAAGAAVTKQVGIIFLALFSILFIQFLIFPNIKKNKKKTLKQLLVLTVIILIIVAPWYVYKQIMIWQGNEYSEVQMIIGATQNAFQSSSISTRFVDSFSMLGKYFYLLLMLIPLSFFINPLLRAINLFLVLPLFISWIAFASYDFRNLAVAIPLLGMNAGISIHFVMRKIFRFIKIIPTNKIKNYYILGIFFIFIALIGYFYYTDEYLEFNQIEQTMNTFAPSINQKLIASLENKEKDFYILTNYPLDHLPGMEGKKIPFVFNNYEDYQFTMNATKIDYLLVPNYADQDILKEINSKIENGEFILIFEDNSWIPYRFIQINQME